MSRLVHSQHVYLNTAKSKVKCKIYTHKVIITWRMNMGHGWFIPHCDRSQHRILLTRNWCTGNKRFKDRGRMQFCMYYGCTGNGRSKDRGRMNFCPYDFVESCDQYKYFSASFKKGNLNSFSLNLNKRINKKINTLRLAIFIC